MKFLITPIRVWLLRVALTESQRYLLKVACEERADALRNHSVMDFCADSYNAKQDAQSYDLMATMMNVDIS